MSLMGGTGKPSGKILLKKLAKVFYLLVILRYIPSYSSKAKSIFVNIYYNF